MSELPQISGKEMGRVLVHFGFSLHSQRGSHIKYVRGGDGKETIIVPNHKVLRKGTLHSILKQLNITVKELKKLM